MKIVRLAIFLTGITGLTMGGIMTLSSLRSNQEESVLKSNENLKSLATGFVDQYFGILEATKNLNETSTSIPSYVTNRAIIKLNQGLPSEFETFTSTDPSIPANNAQIDFGLQERVLSALKNDFSLPELQISRMTMGTYALSDVGNKEGIYIATPIYKIQNGVIDPNAIEKINLTLIDPVKAFAGLQKVNSIEDASAYLLDKRGKVLAHSISAFVGTDMKRVDQLKTTLDNLFLGAQTGSVNQYTNADGVKEQVAFVRAGTSPFAFAVEERAKPPVLSSAWVSDQIDSGAARRNFGFLFVLIAASLVAFSAISVIASQQLNKQIEAGVLARANNEQRVPTMPEPPKSAPLPFSSKIAPSMIASASASARANENANASFDENSGANAIENFVATETKTQHSPQSSPQNANPPSIQTSSRDIDYSATRLIEARDQIALEREQLQAAVSGLSVTRDFGRDFVNKIEKCYTLEGVEKELVQVSSEISESPVLYFRYHRRNQSLTLASVAGDVKIQNYSNMQAYVRKDIELQVEQMADDGKVASISNYGPMSKLIISHLNVAHFEAWAVTSHPEVSSQSKLVGVIVVLQAGMRSAQARPLLARILRDAGNYLYAQSNKIRPRSSLYQSNGNPTIEDSQLS
jgi:hypothetical protein